MAKVATSHGINANMRRGWRKLVRQGGAAIDVAKRDFVPMAIAPTPDVQAHDKHIEVELRRGALTIKNARTMSAAAELVVWTREVPR